MWNKLILPLIVLCCLGFSQTALSDAKQEYLELSAVEDTHVDSSHPDKNYGAEPWNSVSQTQQTYLKFKLPYMANRRVVSAKLSVGLYRQSAYTQTIHLVESNQWDELQLTWNNQPSIQANPTGKLANTKSMISSNRRYEANLNQATLDALTGTTQSHISFNIQTQERGLLYVVSKDHRYMLAKLHLTVEPLEKVSKIPVAADNYVDTRYPNADFSRSKVLKVDAHPDERAYLAFDLSEIARDDILSATLKMKVTNPSDAQQQLYLLKDQAIDIAGITYNLQPEYHEEIIATVQGGAKGEWISVDLGAVVKKHQGERLAFMLASNGNNGIDFIAKGHADEPYIEIQHIMAQPINPNMQLGINIAEPSWYSTEWPFIDLMKTSLGIWRTSCKRWGSGRDPNCASYGVGDNTKEQAKLDLDENGWVRTLPLRGQFHEDGTTFTQVNTKVPTSLSADNTGGRYVVRYDGQGTLSYDAPVKKLVSESRPGRDVIEITYHPGVDKKPLQAFVLRVLKTDPQQNGNYVRNIRVYPPGGMCLNDSKVFCDPAGDASVCNGSQCVSLEQASEELGKTFDPRFLNNIKGYSNIRFMGFQDTNGALETRTWDERTRPEMRTYHRDGHDRGAVEVMTALGNELDTSIWLNIPPKADDNYIRQFAQLTLDTLEPERDVYIEYSNEAWNFGFKATYWMQDQAKLQWPNATESKYIKGLNWYGMRSAQACEIWKEVWAERSDRVKCVVGTHTGWPAMMSVPLTCPLWQAENGGVPCYKKGIDAIAVAPYFGHYLGVGGNATQVEQWTKDADGGLDRAFKELLYGGELAGGPIGGALIDARRKTLASKAYADRLGLDLISYEGGQHLVATQSARKNPAVVNLLSAINRDPRMKEVYLRYLDYWSEAGGGLFNQWTSVGSYSVWGNWGAKEYRDQTNAPKHEALMQYLKWLDSEK